MSMKFANNVLILEIQSLSSILSFNTFTFFLRTITPFIIKKKFINLPF